MQRKRILRTILILFVFLYVCGQLFAGGEKKGAKGAAPKEVKLVMWWWGEQELAGLTKWLNDTIAIFEKEHPGVKIEATLQATENVFSDFPTAAAAGNPPHLQFMWNGVYCMEWVWLGGVEPLNNYFSKEELDRMYSIPLTSFKGNAYRVGWYMFAFGWAYNKEILRKAGVSEKQMPPKTWNEWLQVCEKVKKAGYTPISMGSKDKLLGDWLQAIFLYQQLDSYDDVVKLCTGELRWDNPRYYEHWTRIKELWDKGYINRDVNSLDLYQGQEMLSKGEAAFTIAVGSIVPAIQKALGADKVGYMKTPKFGIGKLADKYVIDIQGIGMAKNVDNKELAAEFIRLMHRKDRVNAMYTELRAFPADKSFDPGLIKDPIDKEMWSWFEEGIIYLGDVVPYAVTDGAANSGCQQLFAGTATPADLGKEAQRLIEEWRTQNPDMLENYLNWMK